ncbi:hypothetical protein GVAV_001158 [Gurleya vavrai]
MAEKTKAPLKLILFGEYAVTKGSLCIAIAIYKFARFNYVKENKNTSENKKENFFNNEKEKNDIYNIKIEKEEIIDINKEKDNIYTENKNSIKIIDKDGKSIDLSHLIENNNITLRINTDTRIGCGLGSSAAISVLLADFCYFKKFKINNSICNKNIEIKKVKNFKELNNSKKFISDKSLNPLNIAFKIDDYFHGNKSSGVDVSVSFFTGLIAYKNQKVLKLDYKFLNEYKILIYDSKIEKNTSALLKNVKLTDKNCDDINLITKKAYFLIQNKFKLEDLYFLIRKNQEILEEIGIVPDMMKKEILKLREMGVESKITGAGNGGHLFTIVDKNVIIEGWEEIEIYNKK